MNYGPLHPVTQGRFRLMLTMQGEEILNASVDVGYLHKGIEKYIENHNLLQNMVCINRLLGETSFSHGLAFVEGIERILDIHVSLRAQYIRVILCESERIISHLLNLGRIAQCAGINPLFIYILNFQKQFKTLCEKLFKQRVFIDFFVPGGVKFDLRNEILMLWRQFFKQVPSLLSLIEFILLKNKIFKERSSHIGIIRAEDISSFGLSGPNARASGVNFDIRQFNKENIYQNLEICTLLESNGDVYARTRLRFEEIKQSLDIMNQCINNVPKDDKKYKPFFKDIHNVPVFFDWEDINVHHINNGIYPIKKVYNSVESPNGEFGVYLTCNGEIHLQRCKINSASFKSMQILEKIIIGENIIDLGLIIHSLDIIPQEIDR